MQQEQTNPPTQLRIGYATSPNGTTWTKHLTPVLDSGTSGEWDDYWFTLPTVINIFSSILFEPL